MERYVSVLSGQIAYVSSQLYSEIDRHQATRSEIQAWEAAYQTAQQEWESTCNTIRAELEWTRIQLQEEQNKSRQLKEENGRLNLTIRHIVSPTSCYDTWELMSWQIPGRAVSAPAFGIDNPDLHKTGRGSITEVHSETCAYPEEYAFSEECPREG